MMKEMRTQTRTIVIAAIVAALVTLVSVWAFNRFYSSAPASKSSQSDLYEKVRQRGVIRAAYYVGAPYFTIDPNTKSKDGIFYQIVESLGQKLNLKVEWTEEVGFGEMIEGLRAQRFDIVGSGIWINSARGSEADFTNPALYDVVFPYARADDHRFDADIAVANSPTFKVSTIDGEMAATIAKTDFPKASLESLPQSTDFTQMILNVTNKKADLTFLGLAAARKYEAANPGQIRNISPNKPLRVFPAAIMVPKGEYQLKRALDMALGEMLNNGEIETIIRRFEEVPGSHYRVAPGYQSPTVQP